MYYFWWGCMGNLTLITLRSERVEKVRRMYFLNLGVKGLILFRLLQDHSKNCKHTPVRCPNGCGSMVQRRKTAEHLKKDCVKRRVTCSRCRREMAFEDIQVSVLYRPFAHYVTLHDGRHLGGQLATSKHG